MHGLDLILTLTSGLGPRSSWATSRIGGLVAHRGLPAGRDGGRTEHAGLRRQPRHRRTTGRDRRHPADVRRRAAVPPRRNCWPCGGWPFPARSGRAPSRRSWAVCIGTRRGLGLVGRARASGWRSRWRAPSCCVRVLADNHDLHTPDGPHRRRLAGGRGPVHRPGARRCCRSLFGGTGGRQPPGSWRWRSASRPCKIAALVAFTVRRRRPGHSAGCWHRVARDPLARAVHADRAGRWRWASPSGRPKLFGVSMALGAFLAGMVVGRSEFSSAGGVRGAADARRLRRAVLRLGRHAVRSRAPVRRAGR